MTFCPRIFFIFFVNSDLTWNLPGCWKLAKVAFLNVMFVIDKFKGGTGILAILVLKTATHINPI